MYLIETYKILKILDKMDVEQMLHLVGESGTEYCCLKIIGHPFNINDAICFLSKGSMLLKFSFLKCDVFCTYLRHR